MNQAIAIESLGVVSPLGMDAGSFGRALAGPGEGARAPDARVCGAQPLPPAPAHWIAGFDPVEALGRKGIASLDRTTQLAIVATGQVLDQDGASLDDAERRRVGVVLGSSGGSFRSIADFVRSSYTAAQPHLVSPLQFPNTVMNCAAAQCAIWHGLQGINSSVCAGDLSGFAALQYAARMLRRGHADCLIAGAVEEFSDFMAWSHQAAGSEEAYGEGGAVFKLRVGAPAGTGVATLHGVHSGVAAPDQVPAALAAQIQKLLVRSQVAAGDLAWWSGQDVACMESASVEAQALAIAGLHGVPAIAPLAAQHVGQSYAAGTALQLAAALALAPAGLGLLTAVSAQGQFACVLIDNHGAPGARLQ
jgi:3-oxoacyl-[acyl-carrier-protein] synthase II